jgi:heme ABC exporter ATP-binding subunit CcmA
VTPFAPGAPAIEASGLRRAFGFRPVLRGVDLTVGWGERVAVFGPNGAGKTTLLRVLASLLRPHGGRLRVGGHEPSRLGPAVRRLIGVVAHQTYLYDDLTAEENLRFYGRMHGLPRLAARVDELLAQLDLAARRHDRARTLSRGLQQRLALARALLHDPPILLLDEPDTGLDARAFDLLRGTILTGGRAVVMTTHDLDHGRELCQRAVVLVDGRVVDDGPAERISPAGLERAYAGAVA